MSPAKRTRAELHPSSPAVDQSSLRSSCEVLRRYGVEHVVAAGDVLFADGDETYDLVVTLEGGVDIVERYGQPDEVVIVTYGPLEFLGEMGLLTGQHAYLTAVASTPGRILRIPIDQVHVIMAEELDLSELILRAFLLRHSRLTYRGSGLTLIGSRLDVDTRRLLEVLARNRSSSRWLDPEDSSEADALLRELAVEADDLPIILVAGAPLLRNPSSRELSTPWVSWPRARPTSPRCAISSWSEVVPPGWPLRSTACQKDSRQRSPKTRPLAAKPEPHRGSRITWAFRPASPATN